VYIYIRIFDIHEKTKAYAIVDGEAYLKKRIYSLQFPQYSDETNIFNFLWNTSEMIKRPSKYF